MPRDERKSVFGPLNDKRQTRQINDLYRITRQNSTLIAGAGTGDMVLAGVQTVTGLKTFNPNTILVASDVGTAEIGIAISVRDEAASAGIEFQQEGSGSTAINIIGGSSGGQGFVYNSTALGGGRVIEVASSDTCFYGTSVDNNVIVANGGTSQYAVVINSQDGGGINLQHSGAGSGAMNITSTAGFVDAVSISTNQDGATALSMVVSGDSVGMSLTHSSGTTSEAGFFINDSGQGAALQIAHAFAGGFAINIQSGTINLAAYTVAELAILGGVLGDTAYVTDATTPTYLGTLTGGGAVKCMVFHNGTAWVSC